MSSELDTATATRTRSLVYQARTRLGVTFNDMTSSLENTWTQSRVSFSFFLPFILPRRMSRRYPRIIPDLERSLCVQRDNNDRLYAPRVAISMRDRDRCTPRFSAPGRSCAPLTAIICKNYGVCRLVGGRLAEAPSRRSSRRHTIRDEGKCCD